MLYVADTHALVKYLLANAPKNIGFALESCEKGEAITFIPTIVLAECFYLISRGKIALNFKELLERIEKNPSMLVVPFNMDILKLFPKISLREIHDQIIVATTKYLGAVLLSQDEEIIKSKEVPVVFD